MYNNPCFRMKTKIRVVLFSSLSLFLIFVTTFRVLWNANHPDIPLIFNQRNSPLHEVIVSDELLAGGTTLWRDWDQWVQRDGTLYTEAQSSSYTMSKLLSFLSKCKIERATPAELGSQLKMSFILEGGQKAVFRPMRYERDHVIEERGNKGADRHNGEIAAFHLARILGMTRVPPVVGRRIDLSELKTISDTSLSATIYRDGATGGMCVYGVCYYCTERDPVCVRGEVLEGSLAIWIPDRHQIKKFKNPCWSKECRRELLRSNQFNSNRILMDITETAVFDFLIGNMDRHHFEMFEENSGSNRILLLDNGKSFGNPFRDDFILLRPLQQLCLFRNSTYQNLLAVSKEPTLTERLSNSLQHDPISPVLSGDNLSAMDRRLNSVLDILEQCIRTPGDNVLL